MSPSTEPLDSLREQANELYWTSSDTVEQVASRLGMSRKAVYGAVQPTPAGGACASCGGPLVFGNRTHRAAGTATCDACGTQVQMAGVEGDAAVSTPASMVAEAANGSVHAVPSPESQSRWEQIKEDLGAVPPDRAAKIGGAAALGVAIGAAAVKAIKKRS